MKIRTVIPIITLFALACGVVAPLTELSNSLTPTSIATDDMSKPIYQNVPTKATYRAVVGCWNIRDAAGGEKTGRVICDADVLVIGRFEGWVQTPLGWICVRAFGVEEVCTIR